MIINYQYKQIFLKIVCVKVYQKILLMFDKKGLNGYRIKKRDYFKIVILNKNYFVGC